MWFGLSVFLAYVGLYFLFAGQFSVGEALAAIPCAALATGFSVSLHRDGERRLRLAAPWPRLVGRTLRSLMVDSARVGWFLLGTLRRRPMGAVGILSRQPFHRGAGLPHDAGRRALVTLCTSLAPNGYVTQICDGEDAILLHRLVPTTPQPDCEWPV